MMVLLGTLYPLLIDALGMGKISVGPPYFNALFIPLMATLVGLMGFGIVSRWRKTKGELLIKQLILPFVGSLILGFAFPFIYGGAFDWKVSFGMVLVFWIALVSAKDIWNKLVARKDKLKGLKSLSRSYYAMVLAHVGVAVTIVGITLVSIYNEERDLRMAPGDKLSFKQYEFIFDGARHIQGPNYTSDQARLRVLKDGEPYGELYPEKRLYTARGNVMTEAALDPGLTRDLYVALGEPLEGGAWAVRIQHKPFVRWLWLGGLLMTVGGLLAATDPRYRKQAKRAAEAA
jgi:cytochrome c-type biogenesis protein CcmF